MISKIIFPGSIALAEVWEGHCQKRVLDTAGVVREKALMMRTKGDVMRRERYPCQERSVQRERDGAGLIWHVDFDAT